MQKVIFVIGANATGKTYFINRQFAGQDCKFRMNGTPVTLQRCEGFASSVCQALTPAY